MSMKSRTIAALSRGARFAGAGLGAMLLSALLAAGPAFAGATQNTPTDAGYSVNCRYGVLYQNASCLHGWWDNTPPVSTGVVGGSTWGMQNRCGDWGSVYGRVKVEYNTWDYRERGYLMENWDKKRGYSLNVDVHDIKCCPEKGELCHKSQVRALSGKIKIWDDSSNEYVRVDVSTREKRRHFCRQGENRSGVYCRNDLSGDAMDGHAYNCGDHYCTVDDCEWHFEQSDAYKTCQGYNGNQAPTYTISATDGSSQTCTVAARCVYSDVENSRTGAYNWGQHTMEAEVWHLDDAVNCDDLSVDLYTDCGGNREWWDVIEGTDYEQYLTGD